MATLQVAERQRVKLARQYHVDWCLGIAFGKWRQAMQAAAEEDATKLRLAAAAAFENALGATACCTCWADNPLMLVHHWRQQEPMGTSVRPAVHSACP